MGYVERFAPAVIAEQKKESARKWADMIEGRQGPTCSECWVSVPDENQCHGCPRDAEISLALRGYDRKRD